MPRAIVRAVSSPMCRSRCDHESTITTIRLHVMGTPSVNPSVRAGITPTSMFTAAPTMTEMESLTLAQIETSIPNCSVSSSPPFDVPVLALIRFTSYHASQQPCSRALTSSPTRLRHAKTPPCKPHSGPAFNVPAASKNNPNTIPPRSPYVRDSRFPLGACQP